MSIFHWPCWIPSRRGSLEAPTLGHVSCSGCRIHIRQLEDSNYSSEFSNCLEGPNWPSRFQIYWCLNTRNCLIINTLIMISNLFNNKHWVITYIVSQSYLLETLKIKWLLALRKSKIKNYNFYIHLYLKIKKSRSFKKTLKQGWLER